MAPVFKVSQPTRSFVRINASLPSKDEEGNERPLVLVDLSKVADIAPVQNIPKDILLEHQLEDYERKKKKKTELPPKKRKLDEILDESNQTSECLVKRHAVLIDEKNDLEKKLNMLKSLFYKRNRGKLYEVLDKLDKSNSTREVPVC